MEWNRHYDSTATLCLDKLWPPGSPEQSEETAMHAPRPSTTPDRPATPRWVIGLVAAIISAILLAVIVMVVGGGQHGPGTHAPASSYDAGMRGSITAS